MSKERDKQKESRQKTILQLVQNEAIQTQMDLISRLENAGFVATQATVSRDIRELQLGKLVDTNGVARYTILKNDKSQGKFKLFFVETVVSIDKSGHILLVKCLAGMANAACELFDRECENEQWEGVVGTLAGDNTFMVLMRGEEEADILCAQLQSFIQKNSEEH